MHKLPCTEPTCQTVLWASVVRAAAHTLMPAICGAGQGGQVQGAGRGLCAMRVMEAEGEGGGLRHMQGPGLACSHKSGRAGQGQGLTPAQLRPQLRRPCRPTCVKATMLLVTVVSRASNKFGFTSGSMYSISVSNCSQTQRTVGDQRQE